VFKARMGCISEERYIYTKGIGFFMSNLFHYGSGLLVIKDGVHGMVSWNAVAPDYKERVVAWLQRTLNVPAITTAAR